MELSSQMVLFAKVVECESFSAAARELGQTPSAVSRKIAHLEDQIGVRLLNRSKHGLKLTEEGRAFHARCVEIAARVSDAENFASQLTDHPKGLLRVGATTAFAKSPLLPLMPKFLGKYEDIKLSFYLTDRMIDLDAEGLDVAIRFTEQIEDPDLIARRLATNRRVLCAAPSYLERFGTPRRIEDLAGHNCLQLSSVPLWNDWHLEPEGSETKIELESNFEVNSADALYHATLAGIGIARLSMYLVGKDLAEGRLVRLLPGDADEGSELYAVYSEKRNLPLKVRSFVDFLIEELGPVPPWERNLEA